ncbi:MAG: c-type cytochrome [Cytophagales bacterium]|nr:c-type cytochrome [Cytophagales bacterium]
MSGQEKRFVDTIKLSLSVVSLLLLLFLLLCLLLLNPSLLDFTEEIPPLGVTESPVSTPLPWTPPDSTKIPDTPEGDLIRYGRELIAHTATYLGPSGSVDAFSNGMNCQNCHLKAGKKLFALNFSSVESTYPKFRARSGGMESIEKRVNDCLERSLNGRGLATDSHEMRAIVSYIKWVGKDVPKGVTPAGAGVKELTRLQRAANPKKGMVVFANQCARCHGEEGQGLKENEQWRYPPLWGAASFNTGAGILRLTRMAGYIKFNMPNDLTATGPLLDDEEAWDVAAFISSMPRPAKDLSKDWPDVAGKPIDHPFGPYVDPFSEEQHRYGPFAPIQEFRKK